MSKEGKVKSPTRGVSINYCMALTSLNYSCSAFFWSLIRKANRVAMMNILIGCVKSTSCMNDTIMDESHCTDFSCPNSIPKITNDADVQVAINAMTYATYTNQCGKANFLELFFFSSPVSISNPSPSLFPDFTSYWLAFGLALRNIVSMIRFAGKTIMLLMIAMDTCRMEKLNPIILVAFLGVSFSSTLLNIAFAISVVMRMDKQQVKRCTRVKLLRGGRATTENQIWPSVRFFLTSDVNSTLNLVRSFLEAGYRILSILPSPSSTANQSSQTNHHR